MRNPLAVGIWLMRAVAAFLAAVWLYQDAALGASQVQHAVDDMSPGRLFLLAGAVLVVFGMSGRRSSSED